MNRELLEFLRSEADFLSHLQAQFASMNSVEIGRRFARFVQYLFSYTEIGVDFKVPQLRQETHDNGVDMTCESKFDDRIAYIQSKYTIKSVDEIDQIVSKFHNFYVDENPSPMQSSLFEETGNYKNNSLFVVVTSSKIDGLLKKYSVAARPSLQFYKKLKEKNAIFFLDSANIYAALLSAYKRSTHLPTNVRLDFDTPFLRDGEVLIGITSIARIRSLYNEFGDSLFLENIREWLGPHGGKKYSKGTRDSPNQAITLTLSESPTRFLARNNGLTFRAKRITKCSESAVILDEASIVNGCQTTMSIVEAGEGVDAKVVVKIVETDDSWDIAQAANFQTNLERMELELARDLRPQMIRTEAQKAEYKFSGKQGHKTAFSVVEELYNETVTYDEFRSLFVGLFSRKPSNCFQNNYSELKSELLRSLQEYDNKDSFYEKLFRIHIAVKKGAANQDDLIRNSDVGELFQRFWKEDKSDYRSYISLVALAYLAGDDKYFPANKFSDLVNFIDVVLNKIDQDKVAIQKAFSYAFKAIAFQVVQKHQSKNEQQQAMFSEIKNSSFSNLLTRARLIAD